MILENKGKEFTIKYDSKSYDIPEGKFEVSSEIGNHIIAVTRDWDGIEVVVVNKNVKADVTPQGPETVKGVIEEPTPGEDPEMEIPEEEKE